MADADLAAELFLDVRRAGQVVGMDVRFYEPLQIKAARLDVGDHLIGQFERGAATRVVELHDGVDHRAGT